MYDSRSLREEETGYYPAKKIMKRLTDDSGICVNCDKIGSCNRNCDIQQMYDKLKKYEDMEEKLAKIYGECDNLLELVIDLLIKHTNAKLHIGEPIKARLLTNDTVDKWQRWKKADTEGRLVEFPCRPGDTVHVIVYPESEKHRRIYQDKACSLYVNEDGTQKVELGRHYRDAEVSEFGTLFFVSEEEAKEKLKEYGGS